MVLLQDVLEGQLDLLLELLHLYFLLEPGPIWKVNYHKLSVTAQSHVGHFTIRLAGVKSNDAAPLLIDRGETRRATAFSVVVNVCLRFFFFFFFFLPLHREWHLPADINTKAENRAISSSDRCIEHKFFPNSKTELIKSSQPATAKDTQRGLRMRKTKEQHSLLIFIGREAHREGRGWGKEWKRAACWQHMGAS